MSGRSHTRRLSIPAVDAPVVRLVIFDLDGVVYRGMRRRSPVRSDLSPTCRRRGVGRALRDQQLDWHRAKRTSSASRHGHPARLATRSSPRPRPRSGISPRHLPRRCGGSWRSAQRGMIRRAQSGGLRGRCSQQTAVPPDYQGDPLPGLQTPWWSGSIQHSTIGRLAVAATAPCGEGRASWPPTRTCATRPPRGFLPGAGSHVAAIRAACGAVDPM